VIMPAQNQTQAEAVREVILSGLPSGSTGSVHIMECDLGSFSSVRAFAAQLLARVGAVDMLMLFAGAADPLVPTTTEDGVEMVYQVDYLAGYLLTRLLLPALHKAEAPRVVHVSSLMHHWGKLDRQAYNSTAKNADPRTAWSSINVHCDTKLMAVAFSNALQRRQHILGKALHSVAVHPGFVMSGEDRTATMTPFMAKATSTIHGMFARKVQEGAVVPITAATLPSLQTGGVYLEDWCIMEGCDGGIEPHPDAASIKEQEWLWRTSSEIVGFKDPYDHRFDY